MKAEKEKIQPYKHDVWDCLKKIEDNAKENDSSITELDFGDMARISRLGTTKKVHKTGQQVWIYRGKKKQKTFIGHDYCPFCGKKF